MDKSTSGKLVHHLSNLAFILLSVTLSLVLNQSYNNKITEQNTVTTNTAINYNLV